MKVKDIKRKIIIEFGIKVSKKTKGTGFSRGRNGVAGKYQRQGATKYRTRKS